MEQVALVLAILAAAAAVVALMLATGAAIRVSRLEGLAQPHEGLAAGSPVPRGEMARLLAGIDEQEWMTGPSVIVFVSPACEPCRELTNRLNAIREQLPAHMMFIEPALDGNDSLRTLAEFEARWVTDGSNELRQAFMSYGTPHLFVIRNSLILAQHLGADADRLFAENALARTLDKKPQTGDAANVA